MVKSKPAVNTIGILELHRKLYGSTPRKLGTAYERLGAAVFAHLGWVDVRHDRLETTPGGTAEHQVDFSCQHPDGSVMQLLAECKHWKEKVGKPQMDTLFGKKTQLQWDAAVITQVGFTRGARRVATDQDIAMVVLRPYDPATHDGRWLHSVNTTITSPFTAVTDIVLHPIDPADEPAVTGLRVREWMNLWHREAAPAETFRELWEQAGAEPQPDGTFRDRLQLSEPRQVLGLDRRLVPIDRMEWTVRVHPEATTVSGTAQGIPVFWLEQIGEHGEVMTGKVITDEQLKLWDFEGKRVVRNALPEESMRWEDGSRPSDR
jgi:hypothetical protein